MKIYSCGFCGAPCNEAGEQLEEIPEGYNPDDYEHTACSSCRAEEEEIHGQVTREMALDAGDPDLEGTQF